LLYSAGGAIKYFILPPLTNRMEAILTANHFIDMIIERDYS